MSILPKAYNDFLTCGPVQILILWGAGIGGAMQLAKMSVSLNALRVHYPESELGLAMLVSVVVALGVLLGATAGVFVARLGYRRTLIFALVFGALSSGLQSMLPDFKLMFASRILEGISHLIIVVAAPTMMSFISAERYRSVVMGLWGTFFGVAYMVTGWLGVPLLERSGVSPLFLSHATYLAFFALLTWFFVPTIATETSAGSIKSWKQWLRTHLDIYTNGRTVLPAIGYLWHAFMFVSLLTFLPDIVFVTNRTLGSTALPLATIAGALAAGILAQRVCSPSILVSICFVLMGTLSLCLLIESGHWFALIIAGVLMFVSGSIQGAAFAMIPQYCSRSADQAKANGALAQAGTLGVTIGVPLFALVISQLGLAGMAYLTTLLCTLGAIILSLSIRVSRPAGSVTPVGIVR